MDYKIGIILIIVVCLIALLIGAMRRKVEWLLNFLMRGILGTIAIYFINLAVSSTGISALVGINPATVLTCGVLGFPGIAALYGLGIYKLL